MFIKKRKMPTSRQIIYLCAICFLFFTNLRVAAQLRFEQWNEENGLPQNWVKGIRQTRDGFLWLTTGQGAARFDGVRFKVFNRSNTPAMASDRFSLDAIHEDESGNLWMGTEDGGVVVHRDGVFTSITAAQGLPGDNVVRIDEDAEGAIWIFTTNGLARWRDGNLTKIAPAPDSPFNEFLNAPPNFGAEAKSFGLWRADSIGWERFARGKWERFPLPPEVKNSARVQIGTLIEDARNRIWYSLRERPQRFYLVENGVLMTLPELAEVKNFYYEDRQKRFWVTDRNNNLAFIRDNRLTSLNVSPKPDFHQVFEDREGTIWVTTESRGLYRIKKQIVDVYTNPNGANNMQPLMQDRSGNVWVGSGGLARFDNGRFENYYHAGLSHSPTFERNVLISLYEDNDGSFWLGVRDGIVRFRNGILERDEGLSAQIKGWVHAIYRDATGDLWFGSEEGLYCLARDGKLTRYDTQNGLPSPHIRVILEDRAGTVWFGTVGGLTRKTQNGFYTLNEADGITPARISSLYEDAAGFLWAGTYDGVLYRIKTESGGTQVVRYATEQGLPYDAIHKILEDDQGFFWIGGQRGIYRFRRQELDEIAAGKPILLTITRLGKDDGLLTASINSWGQPAGFKTRGDGRLWFPSEEGIAVIDPQDLPFNAAPPPVLIEDCLLEREPVGCASGLQIKPGQENLEINYLALSFIKPEQMRFKYRLEGLDADWIEAGTRRTAYYSHLPPGDYKFQVIAANSDGVWNETGKSLNIAVLPPFYRTWWFLAACILAIGCAAFLIYKIRIDQVEKRRVAQEDFSRRLINAHEAERRRVAAELHDSIGQTLAMIKNRAAFGAQSENNSEAKEQLKAITSQTAQAIGEVREISYNLRPYLLESLGLTKAIQSLIKKVEEVHLLDVTARIDDVDGLFSSEAEMSVYRIIQESLNNVAKHSEADEAALTIERNGAAVTIIVADNGRGFDKNAAPKTDAGKGGFGLLGITERVRMLGGTLDVQTAVGAGTKLTVKIAEMKKS